jgi:hypothetical protein
VTTFRAGDVREKLDFHAMILLRSWLICIDHRPKTPSNPDKKQAGIHAPAFLIPILLSCPAAALSIRPPTVSQNVMLRERSDRSSVQLIASPLS